MRRTLVWRGVDEPRMEIARAELVGGELRASGTQIGVAYELRYQLEPGRLRVEVIDGPAHDLTVGDTDFFDLAASPLFNSLPILGGLEAATDFVMTFVEVPSLEVTESEQRYEPIANGAFRFSSGAFVARIDFDPDGFVTRYEGLAELVASR